MAFSKSVRERIYQKYDGHCAYCGRAIEYKGMQIDHYFPQCKARFYARRCNHYKRARTPKQFKELMQTLHERLEAIYILKVAVDFGMVTVQPFDGLFYFEKLANTQLANTALFQKPILEQTAAAAPARGAA